MTYAHAAASIGVRTLLPELPLPAQITLRERLAPIADRRIALTLLTTLMARSGNFIVSTYFAVVFDRAIGAGQDVQNSRLMGRPHDLASSAACGGQCRCECPPGRS